MQKTVKFNIFKENLQGVVWGNKPYQQSSSSKNAGGRIESPEEKPIPKPTPEFWKAPLSYKK